MNKLLTFLLLFLAFNTGLHASENAFFLLSGTVTDSEGEPLPGAYITIDPDARKTVTDANGQFEFNLLEGDYTITCQVIGMATFAKKLTVDRDIELKIVLEFSDISLEQVVIQAKPTMDINAVTMGSSYLDIETIEKLPAFLGEVDVIKSITTLPGVVNAGDGSSGFYVRGGSADQNLILLDDAPVFNSSHLFGFFSVYNPDVLKGYTLHRSGISARYGSRISSILDVNLRHGNEDSLAFYAGISPITAKFGVDGPIGSNTTFLLAGRAAYPKYILNVFPSEDVSNSSGYFYDLNVKLRHTIGYNDALELSAYLSNDGFEFPYDTLYQWSNMLGSLKWNHIYNEHLSSTVTLAKSVYDNNVDGTAVGERFNLNSGIDFTQLKIDASYTGLGGHLLEAGGGVSHYSIRPGTLTTFDSSSLNPTTLQPDRGEEVFAYLNDEIVFNEKVSLALGLRYSFFLKRGPYEVYQYEEGSPRSERTVTDTLVYGAGEAVQTYHGPEPRISFKYSLTPNSSIKAGYSRTRQYIQLISNTTTITPVDVWKLSSQYVKPQVADQFSLGYFTLRNNNAYEFSWEVYYKRLSNQLDYKDGSVILLNPTLEADLLLGQGTAYGSEWLLKKNEGFLTGWVSFSYSRSLRTIVGNSPEETINEGLAYPSNFDKPINLNIFANVPLGPRWDFSANFSYSTGRPITASDSWFRYYGTIFANYRGRNQERMPDYHRLDVSFNRNSDPRNRIQTSWSISVYNLYFRNNAYSTLFKHYYGSPPAAYKLSIIGIAVPSISFNIKF